MSAEVKAGLLDLVEHATARGWSARRACGLLRLDHARYHHWRSRREQDRLADLPPGGHPVHGLLDWERAAIVDLYEAWGEIDRSHRKLAHRGSRLGMVHVSESTMRRVLAEQGLVLKGNPPREAAPRPGWPDWLEWKPNRVWGYDFTCWTRAGVASIAILDIVSRKWLATLTSPEQTSTQIEVAFLNALDAEGLLELADQRATEALRQVLLSGDRQRIHKLTDAGQVPLLLAVCDNGSQMRSHSTREFLAGLAIATRYGRPHTPTDQAWIESLFGHVKTEWPHLEKITDPGTLVAELDHVRSQYNGVRLHAAIGYVTPDDEHEGRGDQIRQNRIDGLARARERRIAHHRNQTIKENR